MAALVGRRVRSTFPAQAPQIAWDDPITAGIVALFIMGPDGAMGWDESGRTFVPYLTSGGTVTATPVNNLDGPAARVIGTNYLISSVIQSSIKSGNYSLFAAGAGSASGMYSALDDDDGTNRRFQFRINAGKCEVIPFNSGGNGSVASPTALTAAEAAAGFTMGASVSSTAVSAFLNKTRTTTAFAGALTPNASIYVGSRKTGVQTWSNGGLQMIVIWNRTLTEAEQFALADNRWRLIKPSMRRLWLAYSASAGGTPTDINPVAAALLPTGFAPQVSQAVNLSPAAGAMSLAGYQLAISQARSIDLAAGAASLTGYAPGVTQGASVNILPGALAITGHPPTISQANGIAIQPGMLAPTGYTPTVTQTQPAVRYARPAGDIASGAWAPSAGTSLGDMLAETSPDSSTFIQASAPSTCEIRLNAVQDPGTSSGQVVRYMAGSSTANGLIVRLKQGAVVIAQWVHATLPAQQTVFTQVLTAVQCDSITDYGNMRFEFEAT